VWLCGSEGRLRWLFGGTWLALRFEREVVVLRFDSVEHAVRLYEMRFGPVIAARTRRAAARE
jgi:hypothetical protein